MNGYFEKERSNKSLGTMLGVLTIILIQNSARAIEFGPVWESKTTPIKIETLVRGDDQVAVIAFYGKPECEYGYALRDYVENLKNSNLSDQELDALYADKQRLLSSIASIDVKLILTTRRKCFFEHADSPVVPMTTEIVMSDLMSDLPRMASAEGVSWDSGTYANFAAKGALNIAIGFQIKGSKDYDSSIKYVKISGAQYIPGKTTLTYQSP